MKNADRAKTLRWLIEAAGNEKRNICILTLLQAASGALGVFYALGLRAIVDSAVAKDETKFIQSIVWIITLVLVQLILYAVIRYLQEFINSNLENNLKSRLFDNILRKEFAAVSATHTAEWMNRLTTDTSVIASGAVSILPGLVGTVVRLVSAVVMIIVLDRWFAFILIPGGIVMIVLTIALRNVLKKMHKNVRESDGALRIFLQERIESLMVVKAFTAENPSMEGAEHAMEAHKAARMRRNGVSNLANTGFAGAMQAMVLVGVIYCARGILTGSLSYGTLTAIMQLIAQVQGPLAGITGYLPQFYAVLASAERLMEVEKLQSDPAPASWNVEQFYRDEFASIALRHISFSYDRGESADVRDTVKSPDVCDRTLAKDVLNDFNLEIPKGAFIALTGRSGCGKSTLVKILMCLYDPDEGERILCKKSAASEVVNAEVSTAANTASQVSTASEGNTASQGTSPIPLTASHRNLFAYVPQGNVLMNGTIREVVSFAEPEAAGDDDRLRRALLIACADGFAGDLDMVLGERGAGLSEGQMQRIAIARAVFSEAPILLLDEATSALDEATEKKLLENLRNLTEKTVVIVTHRKAVMEICDRVIDMEPKSNGME